MAAKKPAKPTQKTNAHVKPRAKSQPAPAPTRLQNLAARPVSFDSDTLDEAMLADNSGVFRVKSALQQAQVGHGDDNSPRFPSDSLVMQAQNDGFRDDGVTLDEAVTEHTVEDEAARAEKAARLATLAARARSRQQRR
jgi:hypothetical protein